MRLEEQVTSLEISKKLKELGVKQESLFGWEDDMDAHYLTPMSKINPFTKTDYAAFTVAELGEMLPKGFATHVMMNAHIGEWRCVSNLEFSMKTPEIFADTEADARSKMLIYLLENNLLPTPKDTVQ